MEKTSSMPAPLKGLLYGGLLGAGGGALISGNRLSPSNQREYDTNARKRGILPGTPEYEQGLRSILSGRKVRGTLMGGLVGGTLGLAGGAAASAASHHGDDFERAYQKAHQQHQQRSQEYEKAYERTRQQYQQRSQEQQQRSQQQWGDDFWDTIFGRKSNGQRSRSSGSSGHQGSRSGGYGTGYNPGVNINEHLSHLGATGNETAKAEVKKKFREAAMKHHPDRGGSEDKMKKVNEAWSEIQKTPWFQKLAFFNPYFWAGFDKQASAFAHAAELGGLGMLAAPSVASLKGKPWQEKNKDKMEIAGLGVLAAPSAVAAGKGAWALGKKMLKR